MSNAIFGQGQTRGVFFFYSPHNGMVTSVVVTEPAVEPSSATIGLEFAAPNVMLAAQLTQLFILERRRGVTV